MDLYRIWNLRLLAIISSNYVWITALQGMCADRRKVTEEFKYQRAVFSSEACQQVSHVLRKIRDHVHNEFSLHAYEAQLSR